MLPADRAPSTPAPERRARPAREVSPAPTLGGEAQGRIRLLGQPTLDTAARPAQPLSDKDAALIAKLALDGPQPRGVLCALLWPESNEARAAQNLRQRATQLSRALDGSKLLRLGTSVSLDPDVAIVDAAAPSAMKAETLLHAGGLLAGCDFGANDELDRWLHRARQRLATECADALATHAEQLEREARLHEALPYARRVVELAPLSEHGTRRLMRLHYLRGDRSAAREAYMRFAGLLKDELGLRPGSETLQLMQTIELADSSQAARRRPVPPSVMRPPVLVGRDAAWTAMALAWQRGQPFLLVGEGGIGKTRLLEEFARSTKGSVMVRAQPGDEDAPLALLGRLLVEIESVHAAPLPPEARLELARIRPEFGPAPNAPPNVHLIRHAVRLMLMAAADRGLSAVFLDDLHGADPATVAALRWLCNDESLPHLRWGLATRPTLGPLDPWLVASQRPVRIDLQRLDPKDLSALLASLGLPALVDTDLAAHLYRHAGGHPLYTLATLQDALALGSDLRAVALPQPGSVGELLDQRLRNLPDSAQRLLRVAAVAGPQLRADRVARMLDCKTLDLAEPWGQLESAGVLAGEAFVHDLMLESAMRAVPQGVRQALHRRFAQVLMEDVTVRPSDIARHCEEGQAWPDAARHWYDAAEAARRSACLVEQIDLFGRAARCFERAGDPAGRCEALLGRVDGLQRRHGGSLVVEALPEVEALADTSVRLLRCHLARAEAWIDDELPQGLPQAEAAVRAAHSHPELLAEACALQAQALAQQRQYRTAREAGERALAAADACAHDGQRLRALHAQAYVRYSEGRLAEALDWQAKGVAFAEQIGYRAEAAAGAGHVAALLAAIGDVPGSHAQALHAQRRHRDVGMSHESTFGIVNRIVLGTAAAALGRYDEALEALREAAAEAERDAAPAARAKAALALAAVWLALGRNEAAQQLMDELPGVMGPGMSMQAMLLRSRAAQQAGASPQRFLALLGELDRQNRGLPLVMSAHFECSYQGDAGEMIQRLEAVRSECLEMGLAGTARSMQWRSLVRWLECPGDTARQAATAHAHALHEFVDGGLSAKCYVPQVWATLAVAYARSEDAERRTACIDAGRSWIERAASRVPPQYRDGYLKINGVNRQLLAGKEADVPGAL